jgi:hypothetical protein
MERIFCLGGGGLSFNILDLGGRRSEKVGNPCPRSKVLKANLCIIKTFGLMIKVASSYLALDQKLVKLIELVPVANF